MAHHCPKCGKVCRCNGDFTDRIRDEAEIDLYCQHCPDDWAAEAEPPEFPDEPPEAWADS